MSRSDPAGPSTPAEWDAYRELPEWEVAVILTRTARLRVHARTAAEAEDRVVRRTPGIQTFDDLEDLEEMNVAAIVSTEAVTETAAGDE
jgi:hypothetical protein